MFGLHRNIAINMLATGFLPCQVKMFASCNRLLSNNKSLFKTLLHSSLTGDARSMGFMQHVPIKNILAGFFDDFING